MGALCAWCAVRIGGNVEIWGLWLSAIGVVVAGAAAVVAWVQAHSALESLKDARSARDEARESAAESARLAGEANAAFIRQAEAQEEANRIKREEMRPEDWTVAAVGVDAYKVANTSERELRVETFEVEPDRFARMVRIRSSREDDVYRYGDSFTFNVLRTMGGSPEKLTVTYQHPDDDDGVPRQYILTL